MAIDLQRGDLVEVLGEVHVLDADGAGCLAGAGLEGRFVAGEVGAEGADLDVVVEGRKRVSRTGAVDPGNPEDQRQGSQRGGALTESKSFGLHGSDGVEGDQRRKWLLTLEPCGASWQPALQQVPCMRREL